MFGANSKVNQNWYIAYIKKTKFGINLVVIDKEIITFTLLKRIFTILILLFGLNFTSFAQNNSSIDIGKSQQKLLKVYPIPAYTTINFDFQRGFDKSYTVSIFNFIGKKVFELKNVTPQFNVKLDDFFRGIYIYQLRDKNGLIIESGKFQVVK